MKVDTLLSLVFILSIGASYLHAMEKDETRAVGRVAIKRGFSAFDLSGLDRFVFFYDLTKKALIIGGTAALGIVAWQNKDLIKEKAEEGAKVISENRANTAAGFVAAGLAAYAIKQYFSNEEGIRQKKDETRAVGRVDKKRGFSALNFDLSGLDRFVFFYNLTKKALIIGGTAALGIVAWQNKDLMKEKAEEGAKVISENKVNTAAGFVAAGLAGYAIKQYFSNEEEIPQRKDVAAK